jgi:hypothetical protein
MMPTTIADANATVGPTGEPHTSEVNRFMISHVI